MNRAPTIAAALPAPALAVALAVEPLPPVMRTADLARVLGLSPSQARRWLAAEGRSIRLRLGRSWGCLGASFVGLMRAREGTTPVRAASPKLLAALQPRTRGRRRLGTA